MATVYTYEDTQGDAIITNGIRFLSATTVNRVVFNDPAVALTTTAYTTAIYNVTTGGHEGSGVGKIVFDNAYNNSVVAIIDNDDRYCWATTLLSGVGQQTLSLSAIGYGEAWGPTERRLRHLEYI
jgi:hypothetical protein